MGITHSTGRYPGKTKVKHSTGTEWTDLEKRHRKKYFQVKHSTGKDSSIRHVTGVEFELRQLEEAEAREEAEKLGR